MKFLGLKSLKKFFRYSQKNNRQGESLSDIWEKMRVPKKRSTKNLEENEVKYCDFRHILEIYKLKQLFFWSKESNFLFSRSKNAKNNV